MKARFYCESCGKEVPFNAEVCPYCGREFEAVKCPICGFEGRAEQFRNGCPSCGYLSVNLELERRIPDKKGVSGSISKEASGKVVSPGKRKRILNISPAIFWPLLAILLALLFFFVYLLIKM